ncbi:type VI secretion system-associated FHA domain protein TagH [Tropicimonas sp. TH_r6]|uniref:type VI secretion system-associated FHA domain protein TagH n=1 Tax=Tropicimonas sp. TH_r6 TaxID=3082085 RepID=UPI002954CB50|nr:type VI secretion system-associated FHA domain protein TagH [Tropicimonas sp. TH_r6]MDV7143095.1 type VI secretion system-associated FHA domain protein TagH [Tropicimonas sp. TH_r6]
MSVMVHFQSSGAIPGDGRPVPMVGSSMTIGRGPGNDLVLPDPERVVSSHHCAIEDQNGNVVVIDLSTNGTFLNYGKIPLGKVPTPLNDGDILSIGNYELAVRISAAAAPGPQILDPAGQQAVAPVGARPDTGLSDLLDAPSSGGGHDVINDLLGEGPVGPSGIKRPELGEDGLLPPLGGDDDAEDDLLGPGPDPDSLLGGSQSVHNRSVEDHMPLPQVSSAAIPDDWDLDLPASPLARDSIAPPEDPFVEPTEAAPSAPTAPTEEIGSGSAFIPDDLDIGVDEAPAAETGSGDESDPFSVDLAPADTAEASVSAPPEPAPAPQTPSSVPSAPTAPTVPSAPTGGADVGAALEALLKAAGAGELDLAGEAPEETAARLGAVLRIVIHGMREILMTRSAIKSEFRMDQTRISASGNNPLKFSVTPEQAVEVMIRPPQRGYLSAESAAEEALRDIKAHEVATMTGMEAALKGVLERLSPQELEGKITGSGGLGGMLKGKKARYWETYERIYADVADAAENDFHELFSREFTRAYQEQLEKLKDGR